ncbi:hypothetical protein TRFO_19709 [Tritrichomonas foetus]|uniref:Uncharacterized protein n=1 Tax=Tritrichomonas foetus TaxID=1144522 RepID=A0A1J4KHQ0_9EUKA|nr:hypothetical protein TRFO_19709 [Tritrichomonas foetus]|eukprot:OHT10905.1 hypothetical protein TRFO_19709 [Tritrichomonas foetus]
MIEFLFLYTYSSCFGTLYITNIPKTYTIDLLPNTSFCINSTSIGSYFLKGLSGEAHFSFYNVTHYGKKLDNTTSMNAVRSTDSLLSIEISSQKAETVTFTAGAFQNICILGFYYSNKPNTELILQQPYIINYDDKCMMVHRYNDTEMYLDYDTEEDHDFVDINNDIDFSVSGIGSLSLGPDVVSVRFWSDFAKLSNYVKINVSSKCENLDSETGYFGTYRPLIPPRTTANPPDDSQQLSKSMIIAICFGVVISVAGLVSTFIYCIFCGETVIERETGQQYYINDQQLQHVSHTRFISTPLLEEEIKNSDLQ